MRQIHRLLRTTGFRLAALYAAVFGLSVLLLFFVVYVLASQSLRGELTRIVENEIATVTEDLPRGGLAAVVAEIERRIASGKHNTTYYLLLAADGTMLAGNMPMPSVEPGPPVEQGPPVRSEGWHELPPPRARFDDDEDAEEWAEHALVAFGRALPGGAYLVVGEDGFRMVETEEIIARTFLIALAGMLILAVGGGLVLSAGFLRRIEAISRTAQEIVQRDLQGRIPTRGTGDELDRLALGLNDMLDRLEKLMDSLRQVSNDIAHDLRTPLSRLRQRLETTRLRSRSAADYEAAIDQAITEVDTILATFAALLRIAQIEAGRRKANFQPVDLSAIFSAIAEAYAAVAEDAGQSLTAEIAPGIALQGDRELLTQMLANVVENAIRHCPPGTHIRLTLRPDQVGGFLGSVADDGPGIPPDERQHVFQRFVRLERSRTTPGNGLGLALAQAVAELHGITIRLEQAGPACGPVGGPGGGLLVAFSRLAV